jgi:hypothetical protein
MGNPAVNVMAGRRRSREVFGRAWAVDTNQQTFHIEGMEVQWARKILSGQSGEAERATRNAATQR